MRIFPLRSVELPTKQGEDSEVKSFEALHEGFLLYFLFNLVSRLTRSIFTEECVTCCFLACMEDNEINLLLQVCFGLTFACMVFIAYIFCCYSSPYSFTFNNICIGPTFMEEYAMRPVFRLCEDWLVYLPLSWKFMVEMSSVFCVCAVVYRPVALAVMHVVL